MATIDQIYRDNLRVLITEAGTSAALAAKIGKGPAQLSQWLNGSPDSKTGKPRTLARATAREIERKVGKPEGWMDQPHHSDEEIAKADAAPKGSVFEALTEDEHRLLANFRDLVDEEDRRNVLEDVSNKAAKMRALRERILAEIGMRTRPLAKHAADERKTELARAELRLTHPDDRVQRRLFEPPEGHNR